VEASSIPSDPQRRKPDDQTCCDGVVEPSTVPRMTVQHSYCVCMHACVCVSIGSENDLTSVEHNLPLFMMTTADDQFSCTAVSILHSTLCTLQYHLTLEMQCCCEYTMQLLSYRVVRKQWNVSA